MTTNFSVFICSYFLIAKFAENSCSPSDDPRKNSIEKYIGENLKLVCLENNFEHKKFEWKKDKKELRDLEHQRISINEFYELLISDLKKSDSGIYECSINNRTVKSIELIIKSIDFKEFEFTDNKYDTFLPYMLAAFSLATSLVLFVSLTKLLIGISLHGATHENKTKRNKQAENLTVESLAQLNLNKFQQFYNRIERESMK